MKTFGTITSVALCSPHASMHEADNIIYKCDAKRCLIEVEFTETINIKVTTTYSENKAKNRKNANTIGSSYTPIPNYGDRMLQPYTIAVLLASPPVNESKRCFLSHNCKVAMPSERRVHFQKIIAASPV